MEKDLDALVKDYQSFTNSFKVYTRQLKSLVIHKKLSPNVINLWVWNDTCLVHDYLIDGYSIAVDTFTTHHGWEIVLFGRNEKSREYLRNNILTTEEFRSNDISLKIRPDGRFLYDSGEEIDLQSIFDRLKILISKLENYKLNYVDGITYSPC